MNVSCALHSGHVYVKKEDIIAYILEEQAAGWSADTVLKNLLGNLAKINAQTVKWSRKED